MREDAGYSRKVDRGVYIDNEDEISFVVAVNAGTHTARTLPWIDASDASC
jgi:hypothetical protein